MSYLDEALGPNEALIHRAHISLWSFFGSFFWMGVLTIGMLFFSGMPGLENMTMFFGVVIIGIGLRVAIAYYGTELGITSNRVIAKVGIIQRNTIEIALNKIESIQIGQSVPGRIFNFGTIAVVGTGTSHAPIRGIADPLAFRRKFDEAGAGQRADN